MELDLESKALHIDPAKFRARATFTIPEGVSVSDKVLRQALARK